MILAETFVLRMTLKINARMFLFSIGNESGGNIRLRDDAKNTQCRVVSLYAAEMRWREHSAHVEYR